MFVDKPIQPLLLPHQEQSREVHQLLSSRLSSSTRLQLQQQDQNVEAQQQSVSSRLGSSALAPNSSDLNMANGEVRGTTVEIANDPTPTTYIFCNNSKPLNKFIQAQLLLQKY